MRNEAEFLIEQILARMEGEPAALGDSDCPDCTLLMASALGEISPEKESEIGAHCVTCEECRTRRTRYRGFAEAMNAPEPPIEGSLLERLGDRRPFVPKKPPIPWDRPSSDPQAAGSM